MERSADLQELHQKAEEFIHGLLQSRSSQRDTARNITNLAFDDNNPLRQLFNASSPNERLRAPSPAETLRPRSSHKAFSWLTRGRGDHSADKQASSGAQSAKTQHAQGVGNASRFTSGSNNSGASRERAEPRHIRTVRREDFANVSGSAGQDRSMTPNISYLSNSQKTSKDAGIAPYNCILCRCNLSSKGVCKRHLEDQHVVPRRYECEKCRQTYDTKAEAKKHCTTCGAGVFYFMTVKPQAKRIYACEFTGERFISLKTYLDHLVELCEKSPENRPQRSLHRKLRALIDQPALQQTLQEVSIQLHNSPDAWKSMRWPDQVVYTITRQLEYATIPNETTICFHEHGGQRQTQTIRQYLTDTLHAAETRRPVVASLASASTSQSGRESSVSSSARSQSSKSSALFDTIDTPLTLPTPTSQPRADLFPSVQIETRDGPSSVHFSPPANQMAGSNMFEQKGKRPLSEHSFTLIPDRHPPGPPIPTTATAYPLSSTTPPFVTSSAELLDGLSASLPYRMQAGLEESFLNTSTVPAQLSHVDFADPMTMREHVLPDTASETTVAPSFHEPELIGQMPFESFWNVDQAHFAEQANFSFPESQLYNFQNSVYFPQGVSSASRSASIATSNTFVGSMMEDQKIPAFALPDTLNPGEMNVEDSRYYTPKREPSS